MDNNNHRKEDFPKLHIVHTNNNNNNKSSKKYKKKDSMDEHECNELQDKYVKAFNNLSKEELINLNEFIEQGE